MNRRVMSMDIYKTGKTDTNHKDHKRIKKVHTKTKDEQPGLHCKMGVLTRYTGRVGMYGYIWFYMDFDQGAKLSYTCQRRRIIVFAAFLITVNAKVYCGLQIIGFPLECAAVIVQNVDSD